MDGIKAVYLTKSILKKNIEKQQIDSRPIGIKSYKKFNLFHIP